MLLCCTAFLRASSSTEPRARLFSITSFWGSGFGVFEVQLDELIDESVGSNSNHKMVKSENLRASTDSDAEEAEGFWDSDDDGADERGGEEEES